MLDVYAKGKMGEPKWRILQERRSLLVSVGKMYEECLHGISEVDVDGELEKGGVVNWDLLGSTNEFVEGRRMRGTRVSLTFRDVLKVKKLGKGLGFLGK